MWSQRLKKLEMQYGKSSDGLINILNFMYIIVFYHSIDGVKKM